MFIVDFFSFCLGRKFNKYGELTKNWWGSNSLKHFKKRADCIEKQYNNYKVKGAYKVRKSYKIILKIIALKMMISIIFSSS